MSFYLSLTQIHPTGLEAAEFIDVPSMAESGDDSPRLDDRRPEPSSSEPERSSSGEEVGVAPTVPVTITPQADGPLLVEGTIRLTLPDGSTEAATRLTLCRCGRSGSKPRCDSSHLCSGFRAPGV